MSYSKNFIREFSISLPGGSSGSKAPGTIFGFGQNIDIAGPAAFVSKKATQAAIDTATSRENLLKLGAAALVAGGALGLSAGLGGRLANLGRKKEIEEDRASSQQGYEAQINQAIAAADPSDLDPAQNAARIAGPEGQKAVDDALRYANPDTTKGEQGLNPVSRAAISQATGINIGKLPRAGTLGGGDSGNPPAGVAVATRAAARAAADARDAYNDPSTGYKKTIDQTIANIRGTRFNPTGGGGTNPSIDSDSPTVRTVGNAILNSPIGKEGVRQAKIAQIGTRTGAKSPDTFMATRQNTGVDREVLDPSSSNLRNIASAGAKVFGSNVSLPSGDEAASAIQSFNPAELMGQGASVLSGVSKSAQPYIKAYGGNPLNLIGLGSNFRPSVGDIAAMRGELRSNLAPIAKSINRSIGDAGGQSGLNPAFDYIRTTKPEDIANASQQFGANPTRFARAQRNLGAK